MSHAPEKKPTPTSEKPHTNQQSTLERTESTAEAEGATTRKPAANDSKAPKTETSSGE